ncbi:Carbonic anhydrase IX, partial [Bulinus truncatus]
EVEFVGDEIAIYAGGLPEYYIAKQLNFHWGENAARGSEHQVDSQSFPMELNIVHYRKSLKNFTAAASEYHGLAVLGFFFEISSSENVGLKQIINNLNNVSIPGKFISIPPISLNSFLPLHRSEFYRYDGSLTTPGCTESVIWTVFKDTIKISASQLAAFYQVQTIDGGIQKPMINNYRPVQPLNLRVVRRNFNVPPPKLHWSYEGRNGTDNWSNVNKLCSNTETSRQSPIDINYDSIKYVTLDNLHLEGYESANGVTLVLKNNAIAVQADISGGNMFISGAGLNGTYRAAQFHFHWGADNKRGSEHLIEGRAFPLEVHIVHYNIDLPDLMKAVTEKNGLAVLGILFELSEDDNNNYEPIISALEQIQKPYSKVHIDNIELGRLLPSNTNDYYRYEGSLTIPGCYETVTWTIFKETLKISERQLKKFRSIFTVDESNALVPLVNNYRPVQAINKRIVSASFRFSVNSGHKLQFVDMYRLYPENRQVELNDAARLLMSSKTIHPSEVHHMREQQHDAELLPRDIYNLKDKVFKPSSDEAETEAILNSIANAGGSISYGLTENGDFKLLAANRVRYASSDNDESIIRIKRVATSFAATLLLNQLKLSYSILYCPRGG